MFDDLVDVCAYSRVRFGQLEHVRAHTRKWPQRLAQG